MAQECAEEISLTRRLWSYMPVHKVLSKISSLLFVTLFFLNANNKEILTLATIFIVILINKMHFII